MMEIIDIIIATIIIAGGFQLTIILMAVGFQPIEDVAKLSKHAQPA